MDDIEKRSQGSYSRRIGTDHPGLILILLDQSGSMADNDKAKDAALAVNHVISEIVLASQSGLDIKKRCQMGVIGYGHTVKPLIGGWISDIAEKPIGIEKLKKKEPDGTGGLVEVEIEQSYWVEPTAHGSTPMAEGMEKAWQIADTWAKQNQESFPPVVINITDGEPDDFSSTTAPDSEKAAKRLMDIGTLDGKLLMFNVHITGQAGGAVILPADESELNDPYAQFLYRISSVIPEKMIKDANGVDLQPKPNARSFIFNASSELLIKLLVFGSSNFSR